MEESNLQLCAILITHHHADHTGGIAELKRYCQSKNWQINVYAPENKKIAHVDVRVKDKQIIEITALDMSFEVIDLAGHTLDHVGYYSNDAVFCGDTLFSGGCGRIFEGTPEQMLTALTRLTDLPDRTQVYCAHEYTASNARFALSVDDSPALKTRAEAIFAARERGEATVPTSIALTRPPTIRMEPVHFL